MNLINTGCCHSHCAHRNTAPFVSSQTRSSSEGLEFHSYPSFWQSVHPHPYTAESSNNTTMHKHRHHTSNKPDSCYKKLCSLKLWLYTGPRAAVKQVEHETHTPSVGWPWTWAWGRARCGAAVSCPGCRPRTGTRWRGWWSAGTWRCPRRRCCSGGSAGSPPVHGHHTHNGLCQGQGWPGLPKASRAEPSLSVLSAPTALGALEGESLASQRSRTRGKGAGLRHSRSPAAAARLPGQGHGSQSSWPCLRADPTALQGPPGVTAPDSGVHCPPQHREHLLPTGPLICVFATASLSHEPLQQVLYSFRSHFQFYGGAICRNTLQNHYLSTAGQKEAELSGQCTPLPTHTLGKTTEQI